VARCSARDCDHWSDGDLREAVLLVSRFWRERAQRPRLILVGAVSQGEVLAKHATLSKRADVYVLEDRNPQGLVAVVDGSRSISELRLPPVRWSSGLIVALGLIVVAAPALHTSGYAGIARLCAAMGAALGLVSERRERRRGGPARRLLAVGFVVILALSVVFAMRANLA
jgi:hypothetical protein